MFSIGVACRRVYKQRQFSSSKDISFFADASLLNINVTGIELQNDGVGFLNKHLTNQNIKFQLLGKDECDNIESIIYQNKVYKHFIVLIYKHLCFGQIHLAGKVFWKRSSSTWYFMFRNSGLAWKKTVHK